MPAQRMTMVGGNAIVWGTNNTPTVLVPQTANQWTNGSTPTYPLVPPTPVGVSDVTADQINAAVTAIGRSPGDMVDTAANIAAAFNNAHTACGGQLLTSAKRVACMIGECAQESAGFSTTTEFGSGQSYAPYIGRGYIQLTWQANYRAFGTWLRGLGILSDSTYFVNNPTELGSLVYAPYTALYYFSSPKWNGQNLFQIADTSATPWSRVSRAINRGDPDSPSPAGGESTRAAAIDAVLAITTDPTPPTPPSGSAQTRVMNWVTSHIGDFRYSEASPQRLDPVSSGQTDCSGLMHYAYKSVLGVEIGGNTRAQQNYGKVVIDYRHPINESIMVPSDLVFFDWDGDGVPNHVEMYTGSGHICGHGGPGMGPTTKSLATNCNMAKLWRVRRYI